MENLWMGESAQGPLRRLLTISLTHGSESGGGWVISRGVTYKTGPWFSLPGPLIHENRIATSLSMRAAFPCRLEVGMAYCTILCERLRG